MKMFIPHTPKEQAVLLWQWRLGAKLEWYRQGLDKWLPAASYPTRLREYELHTPDFKKHRYRLQELE